MAIANVKRMSYKRAMRKRLTSAFSLPIDVRSALAARALRTSEPQSLIVEAALRAFLELPPPAPPAAPVLPAPGA